MASKYMNLQAGPAATLPEAGLLGANLGGEPWRWQEKTVVGQPHGQYQNSGGPCQGDRVALPQKLPPGLSLGG